MKVVSEFLSASAAKIPHYRTINIQEYINQDIISIKRRYGNLNVKDTKSKMQIQVLL